MKKSLLALAVLGAFAGVASAQSSVTLYGRVDLSAGKGAGVEQNSLANGSGSRFGVRGVEDLGGGLQALFNIEHRFNADTGAQTASPGPRTVRPAASGPAVRSSACKAGSARSPSVASTRPRSCSRNSWLTRGAGTPW